MANETTWLLEQQLKYGNIHKRSQEEGLPVEAYDYQESLMSSYEKDNGVPYIVDRFQLQDAYAFDPDVKVQARAIEEFILESIKKEGMRDSNVGYETILERFISRLPRSLQEYSQAKEMGKALELLFQQVALLQGLSGDTFKKVAHKKIKEQRVQNLLSQMKEALKIMVA